MKKNAFTSFIVYAPFLFSSLFYLTSCKEETKKEAYIPSVIAVEAKNTEVHQTTSVVGQVTPIEEVALNARVQGYLTKRNFEPGSFVKKDQLLFEIQKEQYIAEYELSKGKLIATQSELDYAQSEYKRYQTLAQQNATSIETLELNVKNRYMYEGMLMEAKANVSLAALNLSYTEIKAPFDGRIGMYNYSQGDLVNLNSGTLAEVIQVNPIWVEFNFSETLLIRKIREINSILPTIENPNIDSSKRVFVKLTLADGSEYPLDGSIDFIDNKVDPETGSIKMKAIFENPDQLLIPGSFVQASIGLKTTVPEITIPQASLMSDQQGSYVFTVSKDSTIAKKYIKTGEYIGTDISVPQGLEEGEIVLIQGLLLVRPGSKVKYTIQQPSPAIGAPVKETAADSSNNNSK